MMGQCFPCNLFIPIRSGLRDRKKGYVRMPIQMMSSASNQKSSPRLMISRSMLSILQKYTLANFQTKI
ncbi:hypothetical protein BB347_01465 [Natronorubrum daqingense]|uniref:Uncharacterized protein n=1 Tax=Natronorubrum daqingense TaxID=588898 RepID=A0A1P8R9U2_9EURY|nr:hypothetical protein BB347_01465 [Natronorubrum daqingense]